jgi:hypothetical protein
MNKKTLLVIVGVLLSLSILAALIGYSYHGLMEVLAQVRYRYFFLSLLAAGGTYLFMGLSLKSVLFQLGNKLGVLEAVSIAFVSTAVNYFISSMGASGFALRAHLLKKRNVPFGTSVTASVVISVIMYSVLALIVLEGAFWILFNPDTSKMEAVEALIGVIALGVMCFCFFKGFFDHAFRSRWVKAAFHGINRLIYSFSGGQIPHESFKRFEEQLEGGIKIIKCCRLRLIESVLYVCGDWLCTILILYFGFKAVGCHIGIGPLVSGFALGQVMVLIPLLPGGLGAMELTMTAAYSRFGVPWDSALVACFIFRLAYYVLPALLSIFIYWGLKLSEPLDLKVEREEERKTAEGVLP